MSFPGREAELFDYLAQIGVLNEVIQRYFVSINARIYDGPSKQEYRKQLDEVRQAYIRLIEYRKSLRSEEQEESPVPLVIGAGSSN